MSSTRKAFTKGKCGIRRLKKGAKKARKKLSYHKEAGRGEKKTSEMNSIRTTEEEKSLKENKIKYAALQNQINAHELATGLYSSLTPAKSK